MLVRIIFPKPLNHSHKFYINSERYINMGSYYQVNEAGHDSYIEERVRRHEGNNRSIAKS